MAEAFVLDHYAGAGGIFGKLVADKVVARALGGGDAARLNDSLTVLMFPHDFRARSTEWLNNAEAHRIKERQADARRDSTTDDILHCKPDRALISIL
ncbi:MULTISPECIES: hypothetical protein [unclassified Sphingomonas]|uniref:hypothetical protein n=1 Tax=Sphingomonas TaxID=13687 RepID=UPI001ACBBACA|nr:MULTISPECIES: hypothetical protein [unclassified Sphingomonas]MBN8813622.1 hypothetical protein [Sphingomonas sp.]